MNDEKSIPLIRLSTKSRRLCLLVMFLIIVYASAEVLIFFFFWWHDNSYYEMIKIRNVAVYPELNNYRIPGRGLIYLGTFLLECLERIPYYTGIFIISSIFYNFANERVFTEINIIRIKLISYLMLVSAVVPMLTQTLHIFLFSSYGKLIFTFNLNINNESLRMIIYGLTCLISGIILNEIKEQLINQT